MQNPEYKSTMVIHRLIKKPHSLCTLVRCIMDSFNLSLYQRSICKILQCCYSLPCGWLHATNVTASGLLPKILYVVRQ